MITFPASICRDDRRILKWSANGEFQEIFQNELFLTSAVNTAENQQLEATSVYATDISWIPFGSEKVQSKSADIFAVGGTDGKVLTNA